jgi:hypothetical protein
MNADDTRMHSALKKENENKSRNKGTPRPQLLLLEGKSTKKGNTGQFGNLYSTTKKQ